MQAALSCAFAFGCSVEVDRISCTARFPFPSYNLTCILHSFWACFRFAKISSFVCEKNYFIKKIFAEI
eukprot:snap_masked-scaffold_75-processed-gene-0.14-mRNA-1 protein AED:1.00 eAED:1.00 QI:0/0/0/0/1/1/2/0/67